MNKYIAIFMALAIVSGIVAMSTTNTYADKAVKAKTVIIKTDKIVLNVQGEDGKDGKDGVNGQDGAVGPKGDTGDAGPQGPVGPQGEMGPKGDNGTVTFFCFDANNTQIECPFNPVNATQ